MNRYRFSTLLVALLALLAGCMAPPPRAGTVQRSPAVSRPLAQAQAAPGVLERMAAALSDGAASDEQASAAAGASASADADAATPDDPNIQRLKVGLLLPLSGRHATLGKALADAASVSLFDKYARLSIGQQTVRVELITKDTGDTPDQAVRAMQAALDEGAVFIIGPLHAEAAAAAAPLARAKNISVLSLSNTRTQAHPGTYMFGFSPAEQADRVVSYALENGRLKVAVLAPNSVFGQTVLAAAREAAVRQGLTLVGEATYLAQGAGIDTALNTLVKAGQPAPFDAILIPEGGPALDTILRGLAARGVRPGNVKFLGTGLWDDAALLRRVNLESAWVASSPPETTSLFDVRFRSIYGYAPPRVASLSYDAVALAVTLATSGRPFDTANLTSNAGFAGPANGIFRLRGNGVTQRGLAVMQVQGGNLTVISPAPKAF